MIDPPGEQQIGEDADVGADQRPCEQPGIAFCRLVLPVAGCPCLARKCTAIPEPVPPSGHVAGAYAQTDLTYGVQHPPANVELQFVVDVEKTISDQQQRL